MSTNFPGSLDNNSTLPNPGPSQNTIGHANAHTNANDAIKALQAKLGTTNSADATSHENKINTHIANVTNPHGTTKAQVGLGNADNTSDATKLAATLAAVYPVGSIYTNATNPANPSTLLGFGTWTAFGAGRVPVGIDTTQAEFDTIGEVGGAKTHTLGISEIPNVTGNATLHGGENGTLIGGVSGAFTAPNGVTDRKSVV